MTLPAGSQNEEIVMLHNSFNLAVWRLPPAPPPAIPSSAAAAASAASPAAAAASPPAPSCAACPPDAAASCSNPAADPATPVLYPHRSGPGYYDDHGKLTACTSDGSTAVPDHSDAVLLAFTKPRFRAYSITRSPDGRFVAIGKDTVAGGWAQSMCLMLVLFALWASISHISCHISLYDTIALCSQQQCVLAEGK